LEESYKSSLSGLNVKAEQVEHISPERVPFTIIPKQQIQNSVFCCQFDPTNYGQG